MTPVTTLGRSASTSRDLVVEKLAEKAATRQRDTAKGRAQADALELITERLSAFDLWTRVPPGERRTLITRDELAETAVRIADTEGFDALSMRRLAQDLGVGTMSLYHYVRNKDELLSLVIDAVLGELVLPPGESLPDHWRPALTVLAQRSHDTLRRHPWVLDILDDPAIGPNNLRHFDETLQAVATIDLPLADRLDIASAVDEFVFGFCVMERMSDHSGEDAHRDMAGYITALLETDDYPALKATIDDVGFDAFWNTMTESSASPERFERHLQRLLDGIEADIARRH